MNDKTNQVIIEDYYYFVGGNDNQGCLWCTDCNSSYCLRLNQISFNGFEVEYHLCCDLCGEKRMLTMDTHQLVYLYFRSKYRIGDKNNWIYSYLRMFRLLTLYPHLMKREYDTQQYEVILEKITVAINNKTKIKNAKEYWRYANNRKFNT